MLTDAMLREAAAEAERFLLSIVPEEGEPHVFSKRFERRISKLIRRANHPIRYKVMRAAAAVVLVIATLFGTVMAVSPEARAAVVGWVKSAFYEFFEYSNEVSDINHMPNNGDSDVSTSPSEPVEYTYRLSVIPEGYRELNTVDSIDKRVYMYVDHTGQILLFSYVYGGQTDSIFIEVENYTQYTATIHGISADIYIANNENETSMIVWQDIHTNTLFQITAMASKEELVVLAGYVEKIEK